MDFDGDGKRDIAVWRPSDGYWYVLPSSGTCPSQMCTPSTAPCAPYYYGGCVKQWGLPGDQPIIGDYDIDGKADFAVRRPSSGKWYIHFSSVTGSVQVDCPSGAPNSADIPDEGDINGDGRSEIMVYKQTSSTQGSWFVRKFFPPATVIVEQYNETFSATTLPIDGTSANIGKTPPLGTYNSTDEPMAFRRYPGSSEIYWCYFTIDSPIVGLSCASAANSAPALAYSMAGNWNPSEPHDEYAMYTSQIPYGYTGVWQHSPSANFSFGTLEEKPVPGDFDGDGLLNVAVWRPSTGYWYFKESGTCPPNTYRVNPTVCERQWGLNGDIPLR